MHENYQRSSWSFHDTPVEASEQLNKQNRGRVPTSQYKLYIKRYYNFIQLGLWMYMFDEHLTNIVLFPWICKNGGCFD